MENILKETVKNAPEATLIAVVAIVAINAIVGLAKQP